MSGRLDLKTLTSLIESGEIDTVVVAMTDMQGRLMGKRLTGRFFLDSVVEETHGIETELELPPPFIGNAYEGETVADVPKTLRHALKALDQPKVMRSAFSDAVVNHYLHAGNWEQAEYDRRVTNREVIRGFERA